MTVFINGKSVVTRGSGGKSIATDVCSVPTPSGPVPTSFVSTASSEDLAGYSATVFIEGEPVCLRNSTIGITRGAEGGTGGGVVSGSAGAKAEFVSSATGVFIEGQEVVCNGELVVHNNRNTPPTPITQSQGVVVTAAIEPLVHAAAKCSVCNGAHKAPSVPGGSSVGNGAKLRAAMGLAKPHLGNNLENHDWEVGARNPKTNRLRSTLAAHHIIPSAGMRGGNWEKYCAGFGYNINSPQNGVALPSRLDLACFLKVQPHWGHHGAGKVLSFRGSRDTRDLRYPDACAIELADLAKRIEGGAYCSDPDRAVRILNELSEEILSYISTFQWHLTSIADEFSTEGPGCCGRKSINDPVSKKQFNLGPSCNRQHYFDKKLMNTTRQLRVGE